MRKPLLSAFGFRSFLIKIHRDLLNIHDVVSESKYRLGDVSNIGKMIVVLEDRRFYDHVGFDIISAIREVVKASLFMSHGGASTIDMQLVRTITGYRERKFSRKIYEVLLSVLIQYRYGKDEILRSYIHCAFFGSHLYGAERVARRIWGVGADELDMAKAAEVAAMLVYPRPRAGGSVWAARVERRAKYGMSIYISNKKRFDKIHS